MLKICLASRGSFPSREDREGHTSNKFHYLMLVIEAYLSLIGMQVDLGLLSDSGSNCTNINDTAIKHH